LERYLHLYDRVPCDGHNGTGGMKRCSWAGSIIDRPSVRLLETRGNNDQRWIYTGDLGGTCIHNDARYGFARGDSQGHKKSPEHAIYHAKADQQTQKLPTSCWEEQNVHLGIVFLKTPVNVFVRL